MNATLRTQIVATILGVVMLILGLGGGYLYLVASQQVQAQTLQKLRDIATLERRFVRAVIDEEIRILRAMTGKLQLRRSLRDVLASDDASAERETITRILRAALEADPVIWSMQVRDPDENLIAESRSATAPAAFREAPPLQLRNSESTVQVINARDDGRHGLRLRAPLYQDGQWLGTLQMQSAAAFLNHDRRTHAGLGKSGELIIGQRLPSGDALFLVSLRHGGSTPLERTAPASNLQLPINRALDQEQALFLEALDYRGEEVVAVTDFVEALGWGLVVKIDRAEVLAPVHRVQTVFLAAGGTTLALSLVLALWLAGRIQRPLKQLARAAEQVAENPRAELPLVHGSHEARQLSRALQRMLHKERSSRALLSEVLDSAPVLINLCDLDGRVLLANAEQANFLDVDPQELLGRPMGELLYGDSDQAAVFTQLNDRALREGRQSEGDITVRDGQGQPRRLRVIKQRVEIDDAPAILTVAIDDTQRFQAEAFATAQKAAKEAQSQFLANMSHEIRTPMNSVLGFLELALENDLSDQVRGFLSTARGSARSLLDIINDILDLSKLQAGGLQLESIAFSLPQLLRDTLSALELRAREKTLSLELQYSPELPEFCNGDPTRLRQIVTNLVSNAIKFTEQGSVRVKLRTGHGDEKLLLIVTDTGIGMTPDQLERVFNPFEQADGSTSRRFGGTGLGTTICRQLTMAMGGRIWAESRFGEGSSFFVELPLAAAEGEVACPAQDSAGAIALHSPRRFRVLAAEDIQENMDLLLLRLEAQGHIVFPANNGEEAVKLFRQEAIEVVLMDVHMPVMDGMEACRRIRALEAEEGRQRVPILALTASVTADDIDECLATGMEAYLPKPIDFHQLFARMEELVPKGMGEPAEAISLDLAAQHELLPLDGIDLDAGLRRWGNVDAYRAALRRFFQAHANTAAALSRLLQDEDWTSAHEMVHALKGVAGNLSADDLAAAAGRLQTALTQADYGDLEALHADLNTELQRVLTALESLANKSGAKAGEMAGPIPDDGSLEALQQALATDDPGRVEPLLDGLVGRLPEEVLGALRRHVEEFDFEQARRLVRELSEGDTPRSAASSDTERAQ